MGYVVLGCRVLEAKRFYGPNLTSAVTAGAYEHSPFFHLMPLSPNVDVDPLVDEPALPDGPGVGRARPRVQLALERPAVEVVALHRGGLHSAPDVDDPRVAVNALLQHSGIPIQHKLSSSAQNGIGARKKEPSHLAHKKSVKD